MPSLSSWIAPTLNIEELDKRISELKAVHFWLDQNSKALSATIQALEVQKMTLATLQGMNFNMGEMANALRLKPTEAAPRREQKAARPESAQAPADEAETGKGNGAKEGNGSAGRPVDPLQWWGALTQQFQEIAATAMQDVAQKTAANGARRAAAAQPAPAGNGGAATAAPAKKAAARKKPARKAAGKGSGARKAAAD
jgi:hypothetical protein